MSAVREVRLGDVVKVIGGGTPSRANPAYYGGEIPWVTPKDMKSWSIVGAQVNITREGLDNSSARMAPENSILVVVRSGVLKHTLPIGLNRVPVAINQDMKAVVCGEGIHPDYLARALKARSGEILSWVRATTADNFPIDKLKELKVVLPPLAEQRRIADVLDRVDTLRTRRVRALNCYAELASASFVDLFGDPSVNPMQWPVRTIGDILDSASYGSSQKAELVGELPVLRMNNVTAGGDIDMSDLKYYPSRSGQERYLVRAGDVLFNRTNSAELVGKTAIYRGSTEVSYAGYLIRLRVGSDQNPEYLAAFLNSRYAKRVLRGMCKSIIGMANINAKELQSMAIPVPPVAIQEKFAKRISQIEAAKVVQRRASGELDALFASLQHRAFRGEL